MGCCRPGLSWPPNGHDPIEHKEHALVPIHRSCQGVYTTSTCVGKSVGRCIDSSLGIGLETRVGETLRKLTNQHPQRHTTHQQTLAALVGVLHAP